MLLGTIIRKEILVHMLSLRFAIGFMLLVLLVIISMYLMGSNYLAQTQAQAESEAANRERLEQTQSMWDFYSMGSTSSPRPSPLTIFSMGLGHEMSRSVRTSAFRDTEIGSNRYSNPLFILFTSPDLAYIVNMVMSLLAILFTFDAISGEREQQTLKLMLSNSVPRDTLIVGKWIGGYVSLLIPFVVAFLVGLLVTSVALRIRFSPQEWTRVGMFLLVTALYISVFFTMGLLISTSTRKSSTGLMIGLLVWVVIVLGIPNIAPIISKIAVPLPSASEMAVQRQVIAREEHDKYRERRERAVDDDEEDIMRAEFHESRKRRLDEHMQEFENRLREQAQLAMRLSRISPSACYVYATTALMGTGVKDYARLRVYEMATYTDEFSKTRSLIEKKMKQRGSRDKYSFESGGERLFDPDILPKFDPPDVPLKEAVRDSVYDLGLMGIYNVLFFMIAFMLFLRYDAR